MNAIIKMTVCALIASVVMSALFGEAEATYRKPPFNGSIFGKRAPNAEYDVASKALSSICEIASEACQTWFTMQDNK